MPMAACNQIIGYLDELLDPTAYDDYGPNGLQVPGSERDPDRRHRRLGQCRAVRARARGGRRPRARPPRALLGRAAARARPRLPSAACSCSSTHDIALAAYHLPLDGHPEVGNNALLAARARRRATSSRSPPTGARRSASARASPATGIAPAELVARVRERHRPRAAGLRRRPGPGAHDRHRLRRRRRLPRRRDRRGPRRLPHRRARRARRWRARARPAIHFLAAGHYATETFGVRALGERLAERFGVRHVFVDVPNPI